MWDLIDEQGNYYSNIKEISQDFLEVHVTAEKMGIIRGMMTNNILKIGDMVEPYPTYITLPCLDKGNEITFYKLAEIIDENKSKDITAISKKVMWCFSQDDMAKIGERKIDKKKFWLIYSPRKNKVYLGGFNQTEDYWYRQQIRAGIIKPVKGEHKVVEDKVIEEEVEEGIEDLLSERIEEVKERFDLGKLINKEDFTLKGNSNYSFTTCNVDCCDGLYFDEKTKKKVLCPICREKREKLVNNFEILEIEEGREQTKKRVKVREKEGRSGKEIRELLNVPDIEIATEEEKVANQIYKRIENLIKGERLSLAVKPMDAEIVYKSVLEMYIERNKVEPISEIKDANRESKLILVVRGGRKEALKLIKEREKKELKTIVIVTDV